jgi:RecA/RadA recombinase
MAKAKPKEKKIVGHAKYKINIDLSYDDFMEAYVDGDDSLIVPQTPLTTGIIPLDVLLVGGVCDGDTIMLYGPEGCGKSTLCIQTLKNLITFHGRKVLYVDIEAGLRNQIATFELSSHIEAGNLKIIDRFKTVAQVEKLFEAILSKEELAYDVIVIDSITNLLDDTILTRSVTDPIMAGEAKVISAFLKKFRNLFCERGIITFLINQERANLEAKGQYDRKTKAAGCKALQYVPDVILRLRKGEAMKAKRDTINGSKEEIEVGRMLSVSADKNRKGNPCIPIIMPLKFGVGVSNVLFLVKLLKDKKYVTNKGAYFYTSIIPNPKGGDWSLLGTSGLTNFIDKNFKEINQILINDGAYELIDKSSPVEDEEEEI